MGNNISKQICLDFLRLCEKHKKHLNDNPMFRSIESFQQEIKSHLFQLKWEQDYGLKFETELRIDQCGYYIYNSHLGFYYYKSASHDKNRGCGRYISWPDDGKQPEDDVWLMRISFPTGPYIFGDNYDFNKKLFQEFFEELKSYHPNHIDSMNNSLYWRVENAKTIFNGFNGILKKYIDLNRSLAKDKEIYELEAKLRAIKDTRDLKED